MLIWKKEILFKSDNYNELWIQNYSIKNSQVDLAQNGLKSIWEFLNRDNLIFQRNMGQPLDLLVAQFPSSWPRKRVSSNPGGLDHL